MKIKGKSIFRQVSGLLAVVLSLALLTGTGWAQVVTSLRTATVPRPFFLGAYIVDTTAGNAAAVQLGKALFWDMQVGSDGMTACATCHFHAGADSRVRNQMNPDTLGGHSTFSPPDAPNSTLTQANFPFHMPSDPNNDKSPLVRPSNKDVASSQGVKLAQFVDIKPGSAVDISSPLLDPVWNLDLRGRRVNIRRVEPRNTPTTINAAFNFNNFFDGRANNIFNGVNPFGPADVNARVFANNGTTTGPMSPQTVRLENAALASQAVGPPLSDFEMSFRGRTFPKVGKKMLSLTPLAKQTVSTQDSVLGTIANLPPNKGLNTTYAALIQAAFRPQYWNNTTQMVTFAPDGTATISTRPPGPLNTNQFTQMEANFSLFFGIAVQLYEMTLISGETPFDAFLEAAGGLSQQEARGLQLFNLVGCAGCHPANPFTTSAAVPLVNGGALNAFPPQFLPPAATIELMLSADREPAFYDTPFNNTGVTPTQADQGRAATAPFINPLTGAEYPIDYTRLSILMRDGLLAPAYNTFIPPPGITASYSAGFVPPLPSGQAVPPDRNSNHGAFKVPQLRNIDLTGPYMHNGGMSTLRQVVDFYTRGGNFDDNNIADLDPAIAPIGQLLGPDQDLEKDALISFMLALTDPRVRDESAPFDHPELIVPHGTTTTAVEINFTIPAVGAAGRAAQGLPPLQPFLGVNHFQP